MPKHKHEFLQGSHKCILRYLHFHCFGKNIHQAMVKKINEQTNLDALCFRIRGTVEAMLTIAFHSRRHSCSVYTRPNNKFIIVCCRCQRRQSECRAGPLLRNECKARLKFNNRSWNPQIPIEIIRYI